jgi:hypothetical protein
MNIKRFIDIKKNNESQIPKQQLPHALLWGPFFFEWPKETNLTTTPTV